MSNADLDGTGSTTMVSTSRRDIEEEEGLGRESEVIASVCTQSEDRADSFVSMTSVYVSSAPAMMAILQPLFEKILR